MSLILIRENSSEQKAQGCTAACCAEKINTAVLGNDRCKGTDVISLWNV